MRLAYFLFLPGLMYGWMGRQTRPGSCGLQVSDTAGQEGRWGDGWRRLLHPWGTQGERDALISTHDCASLSRSTLMSAASTAAV